MSEEKREQEYGPEPWMIANDSNYIHIVDGEGLCICDFYHSEYLCDGDKVNAKRIVACVNACQGLSNPSADIAKLKAENERLKEAIDSIEGVANNLLDCGGSLAGQIHDDIVKFISEAKDGAK